MTHGLWPRVLGVGRDVENERVLIVSFVRAPTDEELRAFMDFFVTLAQLETRQ